MKYFAVAALGVLALSACNGSSKSDMTAADAVDSITEIVTPETETVIYAGVLPAADAPGVDYTLTLTYSGDNDGSYNLVQAYRNDAKTTDSSNGSFTAQNNNGKNYLKLTDGIDSTFVQYYLIDSDSTVTLVGADLQPATSGLNYTLTKK